MIVGRARTSRQVTLSEHSEAVARCAREWAAACGPQDRIVRTLEWAGRFHDLGKSDSRFQLMLQGGADGPRRCKRTTCQIRHGPLRPCSANSVRRLSRLPAQFRHELFPLGFYSMDIASCRLRSIAPFYATWWVYIMGEEDHGFR